MKTTRNSPRARKERAVAKRFMRLSRQAERDLPMERLATRWVRVIERVKRLHMLRNRLVKFSETGFITKEGFAAWDAL